jgi:hypothetical protein
MRVKVFLALAAFAAGLDALAAEPAVHFPLSVKQGSALPVLISSGQPLSASSLCYRDAEGAKSAPTRGFPWSAPDPSHPNALLALLAVPLDAAVGTRALSVNVKEGQNDYAGDYLFDITQRDRLVYDLKLEPTLTTLLTKPSRVKERESRVLNRILLTHDDASVFFRDEWGFPFEERQITSGFGDTRRYLYSTGNSSLSVHWGVDYRGAKGRPVSVPGRGKVVLARARALTGNSVVIEHLPGLYRLYYHLDSIAVKEGRVVERGVPLGTVGQTGFATGPHLHWEMRLDGVAIDPESFSLRTLTRAE